MIKTGWDINICAIAGYLYEYAKSCKDYSNQKKMLFLLLDTCDKKDLKKWYLTCKQELRKEDMIIGIPITINTINKNYRVAADLLQIIKKSMIQLKREQEWERQFRDLKETHKRKKNFICLLNKL